MTPPRTDIIVITVSGLLVAASGCREELGPEAFITRPVTGVVVEGAALFEADGSSLFPSRERSGISDAGRSSQTALIVSIECPWERTRSGWFTHPLEWLVAPMSSASFTRPSVGSSVLKPINLSGSIFSRRPFGITTPGPPRPETRTPNHEFEHGGGRGRWGCSPSGSDTPMRLSDGFRPAPSRLADQAD